MKIFKWHIYVAENGAPVRSGGTSNAGGTAAPTDTAAAGTGEPNRGQNVQRGLFGTKRYLMITKEKYRPPQPSPQSKFLDKDIQTVPELKDRNIQTVPHHMDKDIQTVPELKDRNIQTVPHHMDKDIQTVPELKDRNIQTVPHHMDKDIQTEPAPQQKQPAATQSKPQNFGDLPVELQARIASMMSPEDRKRFRFVAKSPGALGAAATSHLKINSPDVLKQALKTYQANGIKSLTLSGSFKDIQFNNHELQTLMADTLSDLEYLNISECEDLSGRGIMHITARTPKVKRLDLSGQKKTRRIETVFLDLILGPLRNLRHLDLSNVGRLTNEKLSRALGYAPGLEYLGVARNGNLDDAGLATALQQVPNLRHLDVSRTSRLTGDGLAAALQHVPRLSRLNVSGKEGLRDGHLIAALQHVTNLEDLDVSETVWLTEVGLANALQLLPNLSRLNVSGILGLNGELLAEVLQHARNLRHLNASDMINLTSERLNAALRHVPHLEHLCISAMSEVTDEGLAAALQREQNPKHPQHLQYLKQLRHLDISGSARLENIRLPKLESLDRLDARGCGNLEEINLSQLPALKHLDLSANTTFNTATLKETLEAVKNTLVHLNLSRLPQLLDEHLPDFSEFKELRYLNLSTNEKISDKVLGTLPASLHHLTVTECSSLTDDALKSLPKTINITQY